jgi:two-component system, chemotaxis family, protein-glutamate methylesterase/glutaminase
VHAVLSPADSSGTSAGRLRVLVVDDSAVARQALALVLTRAGMDVATVPDAVVASGRVRTARPDVLVLDLEMPRMDGLTFLRRLMRESPLPVVVCSAASGPGSRAAIDALAEGAVAVVEKRSLALAGSPEAALLVEAVRSAGAAAVRRGRSSVAASTPAPTSPGKPIRPTVASRTAAAAAGAVIAIGASTGGTVAIETILAALPADAPPVVIVQHMPAGFTRALAARLDSVSPLAVREAAGGEALVPGVALLAPGDRHLRVRRGQGGLVAQLGDGVPVSRHCPSVDVLFHSVAEAAGPRATGVLLTGMGDDGAEGLLAMHRAGAWTIAQDEATSVVFGMPAEAIRRGAADDVLPLPRIAPALSARAARRPARV